MNAIVSSLFIVIPVIVVCLGVLLLVRKMVPAEELKTNHEVAGFTLGIIGVLYSVILGFTVVHVQEKHNRMIQSVQIEAVTIADLYREASFFPKESRLAIRSTLKDYLTYVSAREWLTQKDGIFHLEGQTIIHKLWKDFHNVEIGDEKMKLWYQSAIAKLNAFANSRLARLFSARDQLDVMMWAILISGGCISVSFMYFFGLKRLRAHMIMTGVLAGYISFMLYLVYCLDHVYTGPESIKPIVFEELSVFLNHWDSESLNAP